MKSLTRLWQEAANELAAWCCTSTTRDFETVSRRVEEEGVSFLTITLPTFGKDLERALDEGMVADDSFPGFRRTGGLPAFLQGFLQLIFDRRSGVLLDEPSIPAIISVRQLTLMFKKIRLECTEDRVAVAFSKFVECESEVKKFDALRTPDDLRDFKRMSSLLFGDCMNSVGLAIDNYMLVPKHGPGSTADGLLGNQKFKQQEWTKRLESVFPFGDYALPSWSYAKQLLHVNFTEPGAERPVKVISVPKTLKTPRIIAIEPTCMQYTQQAIKEKLVDLLESDDICAPMIGFTEQLPNQELAQMGSITGSLATLDLSEASDRVSNELVRTMCAPYTSFAEGVDACRSRSALVPGYGEIRLAKFASMGSALCFPIEAMVFLTIVFLGIQRELNTPLTRDDFKSFHGKVRIYGDDIIVPTDYVHAVIAELEAFGLKVNSSKSFWTGKFRESCGGDFYAGHPVKPVYVRQAYPLSLRDATGVQAWVDLRNQFYSSGLWSTSRLIDHYMGKTLRGHYPVVSDRSNVLGKHSVLGFETQMLSDDLHAPLVKGYVAKSRPPVNPIDGSGALLKFFLKRGDKPFEDEGHLKRSGRPKAVNIKPGWFPSS